jgi:hypothetical protein
VPPWERPLTVSIVEMEACSVPWNGAVTLSVACEMLKVVPSGRTARKIADFWNPDGHAEPVDQVGVPLVEPLAGFNATADGLVTEEACAAHAPTRAAQTATPTDHPASGLNLAFDTDFPLSLIV